MRILKASKQHECKKCKKIIWAGLYYYPQRRGKALCAECGRRPKVGNTTFIVKLLEWLANHGS